MIACGATGELQLCAPEAFKNHHRVGAIYYLISHTKLSRPFTQDVGNNSNSNKKNALYIEPSLSETYQSEIKTKQGRTNFS